MVTRTDESAADLAWEAYNAAVNAAHATREEVIALAAGLPAYDEACAAGDRACYEAVRAAVQAWFDADPLVSTE